jgi:hypothetical protein
VTQDGRTRQGRGPRWDSEGKRWAATVPRTRRGIPAHRGTDSEARPGRARQPEVGTASARRWPVSARAAPGRPGRAPCTHALSDTGPLRGGVRARGGGRRARRGQRRRTDSGRARAPHTTSTRICLVTVAARQIEGPWRVSRIGSIGISDGSIRMMLPLVETIYTCDQGQFYTIVMLSQVPGRLTDADTLRHGMNTISALQIARFIAQSIHYRYRDPHNLVV